MSDLAMRKGWHPLGEKRVNVKKTLTNVEKLELGEKQSEALTMVETLTIDKAKSAKRFDAQIKALNSEALSMAKDLKNGFVYEEKVLPAYYDHTTKERVFIDELGYEVHREPAHIGDEQGKLGHVA